jgi:hypothetical protein
MNSKSFKINPLESNVGEKFAMSVGHKKIAGQPTNGLTDEWCFRIKITL